MFLFVQNNIVQVFTEHLEPSSQTCSNTNYYYIQRTGLMGSFVLEMTLFDIQILGVNVLEI